jgi:hypothetical protein
MSYSTTIGPMAKSELTGDRVREALETATAPIAEANPDQADPMADQIETLVEAIPMMLAGVGPDDAMVHVSISGHANPEHQAADGWANDMVTVAVSHTPPS